MRIKDKKVMKFEKEFNKIELENLNLMSIINEKQNA